MDIHSELPGCSRPSRPSTARRCSALLIVCIVLLGGSGEASSQGCYDLVDIDPDASLQGTLVAGDCTFAELGLGMDTGFVDVIRVTVPTGGRLSVRLESATLDLFLGLTEESLTEPIAGASGTNAVIPPTVVLPGRYVILAGSLDTGESGAYTLTTSLDITEGDPCTAPTAIGSDASTNGDLSEQDCTLDALGFEPGDLSSVDLYRVDVPSGGRLSVRLESAEFDTFLFLTDSTLTGIVATDDDGAGGTNSLIPPSVVFPASYVILVTSFDAGEAGNYVLTTSLIVSGADPCLDVISISPGVSEEGELAPQDCTLAALGVGFEDESPVDVYRLSVTTSTRVTARLESLAFDAFVWLYDATLSHFIASNDDGAGGTDALTQPTILLPGSYLVLANAIESDAAGPYTLTVVPEPSGALLQLTSLVTLVALARRRRSTTRRGIGPRR